MLVCGGEISADDLGGTSQTAGIYQVRSCPCRLVINHIGIPGKSVDATTSLIREDAKVAGLGL